MLAAAKYIGAGLACSGLIVIGLIFFWLIASTIRNPQLSDNVNESNRLLDVLKDVNLSDKFREIQYNSLSNLSDMTNDLNKIIKEIEDTKNNFISDWSLNKLYEYLDSLTLLQEAALIHILLIILLLISVINILSVFFGDAMIKYFNLEQKLPWLSIFFKLR